ncbi:MAG: amidase [Acidimicrobiales bacterium]|nr:amidase [Acidimicrobiales bacterium]
MTDLDLAYLPAGTMARTVAAGQLSPVELVDNALARIDEVNEQINAFCFVWDDEARAAAKEAADAVANGAELGPLHGVPIALKDTTPTAGHRTTLGSYAFENWVPEHDGAVARKLQEAGAIVVGKTTSPEFAHALTTESPLWGVTRNPWNLERTPGGSSGGSGAAVASGCVPLAEGSDMGGSVRIPSAWCGIVGLKPGLGRIPMDVLPGLFDNISHHGPLARCVDDARLFLEATQGPDEADVLSLPTPLNLSSPMETDLRGVRVALSIDLGCWEVEPSVEAAVRNAAEACENAGAIVSEVNPGFTGEEEREWYKLWSVFMATYYGDLVEEFGDKMTPAVRELISKGQAMDAVTYKRVEFMRTRMWWKMRTILANNHVFLCPTMATTPVPASSAELTLKAGMIDGRYHSPDMTAIWNMISPCPVLTVPCGLDADGLPVGAQLVGQRWRSDLLLRIGAGLEAALPPIGHPPLPKGV